MKLRKFLYDVVIPCKRQLLSRLQNKAAVPGQTNSNASHHRQHTHHYQQQQYQPHSIVELVRASQQARNYSNHALYSQHQTFAQWQHMMTADALHSAWLKATPKPHSTGSPLFDLLRTRILAITDLCMQSNRRAAREDARLFWMKARQHGFNPGEAMFKSPFSITFQRQNCIFSRLGETRKNAMTSGVPRGYATAVARYQAVPQSAKVAFYTGRFIITPFGTFDAKQLGSSHHDKDNAMNNQDQARFRRRFSRTVKSKQQSSKFAGARVENNCVTKMAVRPNSIYHESVAPAEATVTESTPDDETVATKIIDTAAAVATVQESKQVSVTANGSNDTVIANKHDELLEQTHIIATPAIVEPTASSNASDTIVDTLPTNSRYCVAFLLPGPPLYDYLMLDNSNNSSGSHGSVVDESFMRRLTEVMGLNRRQLELVSQALTLLRERIPRLDVRLEGYEVRVFMPLGTPVATVRYWLHEAGLHEGEQYVFESVSSLRAAAAAAASQRANSRLASVHSHQSSSPLISQRSSFPSSSTRTTTKPVINPARDIHAFLVQADTLAQDTTSFSKLPENVRPRCSPSIRLAAARSYSTALNYVF